MHLVHVVPHRQLSYSRSFTVSDDHGEQPELKVCQLTPKHCQQDHFLLCLRGHCTGAICMCGR